MARANATTYDAGKPNWLLRGFVIISLGIHVYALGYIAGLYKPDAVSYIELEMRAEEKPAGRSIPVPPRRKTIAPPLQTPIMKPLPSVPVEKQRALLVAPRARYMHSSLLEPVKTPERPQVSRSALLAYSPAKAAPSVAPAPDTPSSARGTVNDYIGRVRMVIENHKQYPYVARKRRIQGRVVVRFVIETDGKVRDVSLVEKSRYRLLNTAALDSVKASSPFPKPPAQFFSGPVPLEIPIVFTLM